MNPDGLIGIFADARTWRVITGIEYFARREKERIRLAKRTIRSWGLSLAAIFGVEYAIAYAFFATALQGVVPIVITPVLALIVPMSAFAFHLRTAHEKTKTRLRERLRAFVTVALLIIPIALSLGVALELAINSAGAGGGTSIGTIGGEELSSGAEEIGITDFILDLLTEIAPLLLLSLAASLAISFYIASFAFRAIEEALKFLAETPADRSSKVLAFTAWFRDLGDVHAYLLRQRNQAMRLIPNDLEAEFALVTSHKAKLILVAIRRGLAKHKPGPEGQDVFTIALDRKVELPPEITNAAEAVKRIDQVQDLLRPYAILTILRAANTREV